MVYVPLGIGDFSVNVGVKQFGSGSGCGKSFSSFKFKSSSRLGSVFSSNKVTHDVQSTKRCGFLDSLEGVVY